MEKDTRKDETSKPSLSWMPSISHHVMCRVGYGRVWCITISTKKEGRERQLRQNERAKERERKGQAKTV